MTGLGAKLLGGAAAILLLAGPGLAGDAKPSTSGSKAPVAQAAKPASAPAAARQDYQPKPAMWLLEDADTKIYLFGTFHMLPPGFRWRTAAFDRVVGQANELVVETYTAPGSEEDGPDPEIFAKYFMSRDPKPIASRVPEKHRAALRRALAGVKDMPPQAFDLMQTWAAAFMLSIDQVFASMGADDPDEAPGVEDQLEDSFRGAAKPIGSIEDGNAVIGRFFAHLSGLPEAEQVEFLVDAVEADPANGGEEDDLADLHDWAKGRPEKLAILPGEDFPKPVYDMLLVERNHAWIDWLSNRLAKPGTVLVAVGAGHLTGADSVQAMLAKRGMKVTRVQ